MVSAVLPASEVEAFVGPTVVLRVTLLLLVMFPLVVVATGPVAESVPPATCPPKYAMDAVIIPDFAASVVHTVVAPVPVQHASLDSWADGSIATAAVL